MTINNKFPYINKLDIAENNMFEIGLYSFIVRNLDTLIYLNVKRSNNEI